MKRIFLFLMIFGWMISVSAAPRKGYEIRMKFADLKDTVIYLANYFGEKTYLLDTAKIDGTGKGVFSKEEPLEGGVYIVALGKTKMFEFIVDKSQFFSLETSGPDYVKNMKFKGSEENQMFYDYLHFNSDKYMEAEPWQKLQAKVKNNKDSLELVRNKLTNINKEVEDYKVNFIKEHPESFMAIFFKALKDPELPPAPVKADGKRDSAYLFYYYRQHYWDNVKLTDDRLLRTPFFHGKVTSYFEKLVVQRPDSIIREIDQMIEKVRENKEMFKYFVWYFTNTYETSNVMGFDEIFVYMVEKYYMTNQAYWVNATVLENLTKRAQKLKPILIGKTAPEMIMQDTSMNLVSMSAIKAKYTILYFWDPECGHCKTESPKLKQFYDEYKDKYNFEVYGVCADTNMVKMKEYIKKNQLHWINVDGPRSLTPNYHDLYDVYSTPVIYLLDEKKTILAKRLLTDPLKTFIERLEEEAKKKSQK